MLGPDAPPHPLHVAEEHDDAEEREVAGDAYEGAGDGEVVQQVPEAGSRDSKGAVTGTSLLLRAGLSSGCTSPSLGAFTQLGARVSPTHWGSGGRVGCPRHRHFKKFPREQTKQNKSKLIEADNMLLITGDRAGAEGEGWARAPLCGGGGDGLWW